MKLSDPDSRFGIHIFHKILSFVETLHTSDRLLLKLLILLTIASIAWLLLSFNTKALVEVPKQGGTLTEGIVGTPRFGNPLLAVTNADKDVVSLLYSGLMRLNTEGNLVPDVAESITIADDGLVYNVVLKQNVFFHDGTKLTADDVIFSVNRIQDPALKSPLLASWEGVSTERLGDFELNFVLEQQYSPFVENLTLGILPRHIWEEATTEEFPFSQFNSEPIGTGAYKIERITRNASGIPESYILVPHTEYHGTVPKIDTFRLVFFTNEAALVDAIIQGAVDNAAGISHESLALIKETLGEQSPFVRTSPLPRTFALFFNQNEAPVFRDEAVRKALDVMIDRSQIVGEILGGYGKAIDGPIPPGFGIEIPEYSPASQLERLELAKDILRDGGWKLDEETGLWTKQSGDSTIELTFSIATANTPMFQRTADILKASWEELGAVVDVKKFEQTDLTQSIIRPRKYDALLFGTVVGRELDFYSFWHSSQRNDPGLNVSLYANITTDSILADARTLTEKEERLTSYERFASEVSNETPAIFLFVPEFIYVTPHNIEHVLLTSIAAPHERFSSVMDWFIETESVWPMFADTENN